MAEMRDMLEQTLGGQTNQIAARIGADPAQTQTAISAALPAILAGLQQQADPSSGLQRAVEEDHDGSILNDIPGYLDGTANLSPRTTNGTGILEHVFGDRERAVEEAVSAKSGLDLGSIAQLLPILAPIVMGMLGKQARSGSTGSSGSMADLGSILGGLGGLGGGSTTGSNTGGLDDLLGSILSGNQRR